MGIARTAYSVFDPDFVSRFVARRWGWKQPACVLWNRGTSDTYRLESGPRCAYLKIHRHGERSRTDVQGEIDLLRLLSERNVRVSLP